VTERSSASREEAVVHQPRVGLGVDIGSRSIKVALVAAEPGARGGVSPQIEAGDQRLIASRVVDTTFDPLAAARAAITATLEDARPNNDGLAERPPLTVTGYGRHLFAENEGDEVITEIKAVARGALALWPSCRGVIDIGGQDTKAIALDARGKLHKFAMNDRCAAGTGRSLEVLAVALALTREQLIEAALGAARGEKLSSMCAVFAETEVVSLVARGATVDEIALGIHQAVVRRTAALASTVPLEDDVLFTGGGALNGCLRRELERELGRPLHVAEDPQCVAAFGCALSSLREVPRKPPRRSCY
jgi:predicted CoA-substrate-specific enzyme activase